MGHLNEDEALKIVYDSENSFSYKKLTKDDIQEQRVLKLPSNYVGDYEELNEDPNNPNSAIFALFQHKEKTYDD